MSKKRTTAPYFSESLMRGLLVVKTFDRGAPLLRMSEVAHRTGLTRAAARRFLLTLLDLGYVGTDGERFFLRPKVLELGFSYFSSANIDHIVQPFLNELAEATQQTSSFAVLDLQDVLFVARAANKQLSRFSISIGGRSPAHRTSLGLVLLAGLSTSDLNQYFSGRRSMSPSQRITFRQALLKVRRDGCATFDSRREEGIVTIAVPIHDRTGAVVAAINIVQYPGRDSRAALTKKYLVALRKTADQIGAALSTYNVSALNTHQNFRFRDIGE